MRFRLSALTFLLFAPALLTSHPVPQTPADQPDKPLYRSTGKEATLLGAITVKGPLPKPMRIDLSADPVCMQLNKKPEVELFATNQGGLLNAFVYVLGEPVKAYRFAVPDSEVTLQRVNCEYTPRVVGLRVGQKFAVVNNDPTTHNTHPTPKLNVEWNQSQPPSGLPILKTFTRQEVPIPFKCNQHPWEKAYVGVLDHPFFSVSNEFGNYEISGLPPGTYKLIAWHEAFAEQEIEITLGPGETRRIDFAFDVDNNLKKTWPYWQKDSETPRVEPRAAGSFPGR